MQQPTVSPTENSMTKVFKHGDIQVLCEQVTMLVGGGDTIAFKHRRNEIPTPKVAVGKVFGVQGCPGKLHVGKLQSWLVILQNGGVDALHLFGNAKGSSNFLKELFQRKELATGSGQGDILVLHCSLSNENLKFAAP
eukprot:6903454-Ditylum_brightwellii.AAC.1